MYKFFIGWRYIKSRLITIFSIIGVAIGVMVLIIVPSVMDGFRKEFISRLQGVLSHIIISIRTPDESFKRLEDKILSVKHVKACAPHLRGLILIGTNRYYVGGMVLGIDYEKERKVGKLENYLVTAYKEIKFWAEDLLENNVKYPNRIELKWEVIGGGKVEKQGRFPAGYRIVCLKKFISVPNNSLFFKKTDNNQRKVVKKVYNAYTFNKDYKIIFIENKIPEEFIKDTPKLTPQDKKKWQDIFNKMGNALNSRDEEEFLKYFSKDLRFARGSIEINNPFYFEPEDPDEIIEDIRPLIVGYELMRQLGMKRGDEVTLMTGRRDPKTGKLKAVSRKFTVVGGFKSGWQEIDAHLVYAKREDLLGFLDVRNDVTEISVALDNYAYADKVKLELDKKLNEKFMNSSFYPFIRKGYIVQKWEEHRKSLLSAIKMEKFVMTIIVSLIVILAVVSIMIILILLVAEKIKDIGILKSMGATNTGILNIFLFNGLFISIIGAFIGCVLGVIFCLNINEIADTIYEWTKFRVFPRDVYYLDKIPVSINPFSVGIIVFSTIGLSLLACAIPALKAALLDPVQSLNTDFPSLSIKLPSIFNIKKLIKEKKRKNKENFQNLNPSFFLEVINLVKIYKMGGDILKILQGIELKIQQGEIVVILGSSGAGKSTLLNLIGLLDTPTDGTVFLEGKDLYAFSSNQRAKIRNRDIGFIFQFYHLLPELNALENVILPAMIRYNILEWNLNKHKIVKKAKELLEKVGLKDRLFHKPAQLSGGERQRVAIARALVMSPKIVLCDEPTGNLDEQNSKCIQELIWKLNKEFKQTFIIVTHEESIAKKGDRVFKLEHGKLNLIKFEENKINKSS